MGTIKGIIFDFDGLILDTETPEFKSMSDLFNRYGTELTAEEWGACLGTDSSAFNVMQALENKTGLTLNHNQILKESQATAHEIILKQPPLPGVQDLIKEAKTAHLKICVASSSNRDWVEGHLTRLGLLDSFDEIVCREDVAYPKPEPELYLLALKRMGLQSNEAFALEDSPNGITAAIRAGLYCVAVPNPLSSLLDTSHASLTLKSLAEIRLSDLLEAVQVNSL